MRHTGRTVDDLPLANEDDLFLALGGAVVEVHVPLDHVHDLLARVAVELTAVLAPARDEGDAVRRLPEDADRPRRLRGVGGDVTEIDGAKFAHGSPRCATDGTATLPGGDEPVKRAPCGAISHVGRLPSARGRDRRLR
jgi:hypothetical protein